MGTSLKSVSRASGIVNLHFLYATLGDEEVSAEIVDRRRQRCVEAGVEAPAEAK